MVPFQNIKANTPAGNPGKGILHGVYLILEYIFERAWCAISSTSQMYLF